jgi:hypothetical protein
MVDTYYSLEANEGKSIVMTDRQNTIICLFDTSSPRTSAYHIHEWIYESFKLPEADVRMIQIDWPRCRVYTKFNNSDRTYATLQATYGGVEFRHNGDISVVSIELASVGTRSIRLANLPSEVPDRTISVALSPYAKEKVVHEGLWSTAYRYPVYNGVTGYASQ